MFAESLANDAHGQPASYRSSASRAYYSAFHFAQAFLVQANCRFKGGNEHKLVQNDFLNCNVEEGRLVGQSLANLHQSRKEADYELAKAHAETQANAQITVQRAQAIVAKLTGLDAETKRKITAGVAAYRAKIYKA